MTRISELRYDHIVGALSSETLMQDPIAQFKLWLEDAMNASLFQPNAMTLATVSKAGVPSVRTVLLKEVSDRGFVFYTNLNSKKAQEIAFNPHVSLLFHFDVMQRQVNIQGLVSPIPEDESDAYFNSRPRDSQISAWASRQSEEVESRAVLEAQEALIAKKYEGADIPRPPFWGGYCVQPQQVEFWQAREGRLHDRLCYVRQGDCWDVVRLQP